MPQMLERDIRGTELYREAEDFYKALRQPGTGQICDAAELHVAPNGKHAVFSGTLVDALEGVPPTRVCRIDLTSGEVRVLTFGPNIDRSPKYSPDGRYIAFLSDRHRAGDFQLYLFDIELGAAKPSPRVPGWVEYFHWSPDGARILLGVAGHGADRSSAHGAVTSQATTVKAPSWAPTVEIDQEECHWRQAWLYELSGNRVLRASGAGNNIWEAVWCGNERLAAVVSSAPGEGHWYAARLNILGIGDGSSREIYRPKYQLGCLAASASGTHLAIVEALCSDRGIVAGDLLIVEGTSGEVKRVDTRGVDISHTECHFDRHLLVAGLRGFETVVGTVDVLSGSSFTETWASSEISNNGTNVVVAAIGDRGDCALVGESFLRSPEIAVILSGGYTTLRSLAASYERQAKLIGGIDRITWRAQDGLEIEGLLLRPLGRGPYPIVMNVHGGPVWHWRPRWLGRGGAPMMMLIKRGCAVFLPNPRGSSGRGQAFARRVLGEMGGADAQDCLSGLDHLVARGIADPARLGVIGGSYGGYLTSWLITQDTRFAAAVSLAPITNHVSHRLTSNIPHFARLFLEDSYATPGGRYFQRSPIMHAHRVKTPVLNVSGALDRCTPPMEAMQFHNAVLEHGIESVLLVYPEEGHGVRKFPATFDCAARIVAWFERHMPAASPAIARQE